MPKMTNLEAVRESRQISRNALAVGVGVSRTTIVKLETGETEEPTYSLVIGIANFLGVPDEALFLPADSNISLLTTEAKTA